MTAGKRPAGYVAGDVISSAGDPNRGKWLNVWGSAYSYPVLHATPEAAAAVSELRGACVAHVTEYPMPGAAIGQCYRITPGTLTNRTDPAAPPVDYDGTPVFPEQVREAHTGRVGLYDAACRCADCLEFADRRAAIGRLISQS